MNRTVEVNDMVKMSEAATVALGGLDLPQDGPQAIRLYFQGFG